MLTVVSDVCPQVRLQVGLYIVYILDWLTVFSKNQILVLRLEDHASNRKYTMHKVFNFLNLGKFSSTIVCVKMPIKRTEQSY